MILKKLMPGTTLLRCRDRTTARPPTRLRGSAIAESSTCASRVSGPYYGTMLGSLVSLCQWSRGDVILQRVGESLSSQVGLKSQDLFSATMMPSSRS
jgi:hypothetical protein